MKGEPEDEVVVGDVDEEFRGGRLDDLAHGALHPGIEARSGLVGGGLEAGCHDPCEHEGRQMLQVGRAQFDVEMTVGQTRDDRRDLVLRRPRLGRRRLESAVLGDPVGGDGDVHDDVGDADLVHEVAETAELADELGLERAEGRGADRVLAECAAQRDEIERSGIHLIVGETAEQAPLRHLGPAEPRLRRRALQCELGPGQEAAHAREVRVDRRHAHVQRIGGLEDIDPLRRVEERPHEGVEPVAGRAGVCSAQRGGRWRHPVPRDSRAAPIRRRRPKARGR